jgi:hypothetical protein
LAFYIGEYELLRLNASAAKTLLREAMNTCFYTHTSEYIGAVTELRRLK